MMLQECKAGERFEGTVIVREWREVPFRQKKGTYLMLNCQDKTGTLPAKIWEPRESYTEWLKQSDVFRVRAAVTEYRGALELTIDELVLLQEDEINLEELLPSSPVSEESLEGRTGILLGKMRNTYLLELLENIINDSHLGKAYKTAPAAYKVHQAYLRGLWEHSVAVAEIALSIAENYPDADKDLIAAGALLHDIGKTAEYSYSRAIQFTTEGRLLGHIIMGIEILSREISRIPDFSPELKSRILHIITSHHGRYEWQSPKKPKLKEAFIVHYADVLESELWQFNQAQEAHPEDEWSPYLQTLERYVYLK